MAESTTSTPTNTSTQVGSGVETQELEATDTDSAEDTEVEAQPTEPEKKAEVARRKKLKLKVDGKEVEEEIDFDDDEALIRDKQLARVAQKRMGEYAQLQKEVREWVDQLRKDPRSVLADPTLGIDLKQLAASVMQEEIENSQKSPETLESERIQKELRDLKAQREKEQEEFKQKEFERLQEKEFERMDTLMTRAIEKTDLPKTDYVIKRMADYMILGVQGGVDATPDDVLPIVREEMLSDMKAMFQAMGDEVIEKMLGKETISRLRKRSLARAKATPTPVAQAIPDSGKKPEQKKPEEKKTIRQLWGI